MGMMKHKQRPDHAATMASGIKAWTVQEKNGLKDLVMVGWPYIIACFVFIRTLSGCMMLVQGAYQHDVCAKYALSDS